MSESEEEFIWPEADDVHILHADKAFDRLLSWAAANDVSDISVQTRQPVWCERHGRMRPATRRVVEPAEALELINLLYGSNNGAGQVLSGSPIDTGYDVLIDRKTRLRYRVNATAINAPGGQAGVQITLRSIPSTPPIVVPHKDGALASYRPGFLSVEIPIVEAFSPKQGIILVTGPTGSGKSTLLAAGIRMLAEQERGNRKILTMEAPIEFVYDGIFPSSLVSQSEVGKHLGSFSDGVRNAMRRKPSIMLVGEARDRETIEAAIEASLTGHLVFSTVHSNSVPDTVRRMVQTIPSEDRQGQSVSLMEALRMIVTQALLKTVDGKRVACREYLIFDDDVREELLDSHPDQWGSITRKILRERGQPMAKSVQKVLDIGLVTEEEARPYLRRSE
jgi:defect-in-organelle-trafficking protein DotB